MEDIFSIRGLEQRDISLISNYWLNSSQAHLQAMGVDINKLPGREGLEGMLEKQLALPIEKRNAYCLIWELNGNPVGHNNTNPTFFGDHAFMHLHIWNKENRGKGLGEKFLELSIPEFFSKLQLKKLYSEPYALNPAPNKTLEKLGFSLEKEYITIPGSLNFEQPVKRWFIDKSKVKSKK